ncbi:MAG: WD40 repeat domain-containing protein [Gemmataceae bacterium]|nr:WD40 repeat domain-containing protein [Gemmataceae bacterium]
MRWRLLAWPLLVVGAILLVFQPRRVRWTVPLPAKHQAWLAGDRLHVFGDGKLAAHDLATGRVAWTALDGVRLWSFGHAGGVAAGVEEGRRFHWVDAAGAARSCELPAGPRWGSARLSPDGSVALIHAAWENGLEAQGLGCAVIDLRTGRVSADLVGPEGMWGGGGFGGGLLVYQHRQRERYDLVLWNLARMREAGRLPDRWDWRLSADGRTLAALGGGLELYDVSDPTAPSRLMSVPFRFSSVVNVHLSPDGTVLAGVSIAEDWIRAWDCRTGAELWRAPNPSKGRRYGQLQPDQSQFFLGTSRLVYQGMFVPDDGVHCYDLREGKKIWSAYGMPYLRHWGDEVAWGLKRSELVRVDLATGRRDGIDLGDRYDQWRTMLASDGTLWLARIPPDATGQAEAPGSWSPWGEDRSPMVRSFPPAGPLLSFAYSHRHLSGYLPLDDGSAVVLLFSAGGRGWAERHDIHPPKWPARAGILLLACGLAVFLAIRSTGRVEGASPKPDIAGPSGFAAGAAQPDLREPSTGGLP